MRRLRNRRNGVSPVPKKGNEKSSARHELDAFDRQVEAALEHFSEPTWLGEHSPLAAPYFLGEDAPTLAGAPAGAGLAARQRGEQLRTFLLDCAARQDAELRALLQVTYFARNPAHDNVALALALSMSDRTFYRARSLAIKALGQTLHTTVSPPVRLERPATGLVVGRERLLAQALAQLHDGRSVYLSGPSGVGKSTTAAALARVWQTIDPAGRAFWYTLRDHANDHIASLLFVLAWFLRTAGAGNTWRQLVADRTVVDLEQALSLLRYDLESLQGSPLLFCIDDMDVLTDEQTEHVQILDVLESLHAYAPLLLVGQRIVLATDEAIVLPGLDEEGAAALLAAGGCQPLPPNALAALVHGTRGHPALLRLIGALLRDGDDPAAALAELGHVPTIEAVFHRIWRRMDSEERALALQLSVFRTPVPADAWSAKGNEGNTVKRLAARGLLAEDQQGAIALQPHLRPLLYDRIPPEARPHLHARASEVRATRAEYTRAVEHAIAARRPAHAVWLWFEHRHSEIDRGQGPLALQLLRQISLADLPVPGDRTALQLARSELHQLAGHAEEALAELRTVAERVGRSELAAYVAYATAEAEEMAGQLEQALEHYRSAIELYVGLPAQHEVVAHLRISFLQMYRMHDVDAARREAIVARAKADAFLGDLEAMAGRYESALHMLHAAESALDQYGDDLATRSRVCTYLSTVYTRLGNHQRALDYLDRAIDCDHRRGDAVGPLYSRLNRAWVLKELGRLPESEEEARDALRAAERLQNGYLIAGLAAGVGEACLALGRLDQAEHFSLYSFQQEEIFFRAPACIVLAWVRTHQGRQSEAEQLFGAAIEHAQQIDDRATEAYAWRERGRAALHAGDAGGASRAMARAVQLYTEMGLAHEVRICDSLPGPANPAQTDAAA